MPTFDVLKPAAAEPIAAIVRTIFRPTGSRDGDRASAEGGGRAAEGISESGGPAGEAAEDVLAYRRFASEHQRQLHSTNVLERLNKQIKRGPNVVGIFPSAKRTLR